MKKFLIAFDVDGTLVNSEKTKDGVIVANEDIRSMLITMSRFKNVRIVVWSGSGEIWANQVVNGLGLKKYVWKVMAKNIEGRDENDHPIITADIRPHIAIDDIQSCTLGIMNLIVREK